MRILFISKDYRLRKDGGSAVTMRNLSLLQQIADEVVELHVPVPSLLTRLRNILFREGYAQTSAFHKALDSLLDEKFDLVFLDNSVYGVYLVQAKRKGQRTCCFCHNVEQKYYRDKFKVSGKLQDRIMVDYVVYCERITVGNADSIITLNERDSLGLLEYYGRGADFICPTSFDSIDTQVLKSANCIKVDKPYALFVGSNFFANVEGLEFLCKEVAPYVDCDIRIVGSVCQAFKDRVLPPNVILEGVVDDLLPYYSGAGCVVSPIFSGSGLKTKTIEALRYGKFFIGTGESFVGIDPELYDRIGRLCNTRTEFIDALNCATTANIRINEKSLELFRSQYSTQAQLKRFRKFIGERV